MDDIKKSGIKFGAIAGASSLIFAPFIAFLGACCVLGTFLQIIPVVLAASIGGFLAVICLDWTMIHPSEATSVGVKCGGIAGLVASLISTIVTFLITTVLFGIVLAGIMSVETESGSSASGKDMAMGVGGSILMNLVITLLAVIPGIISGILSGVVAAAIKKPASPQFPS